MKIFKLLLLLVILPFIIFCTENPDETNRMILVIKAGNVDSTFTFSTSQSAERPSFIELTYLGKIKDQEIGIEYVILKRFETYWVALTRRGASRVIICSSDGKIMGYYEVYLPSDLPSKLVNGELIFNRQTDSTKYLWKQNLSNGLPKYLCVDNGDCYSFIPSAP